MFGILVSRWISNGEDVLSRDRLFQGKLADKELPERRLERADQGRHNG